MLSGSHCAGAVRGGARRSLIRTLAVVVAGAVAGVAAPVATAATSTFSFTGREQSYTVPAGVHQVRVTATGGAGGGPTAIDPAWGYFIPGGRAAVVSGVIPVLPGQVLSVEVGGIGGKPAGGFNGGGTAGQTIYADFELSSYGGGGASDVRMLSAGEDGSLLSRLVVAAGGGGSAHPAAGGGDAGQPGFGNPVPLAGGGAGTSSGGGGAGCAPGFVGCGTAGTLGTGGNGGTSPGGYEGGGGGAGLFGGGGGAGDPTGIGGGGGGSSAVPRHGTAGLAASYTTDPTVTIETVRGYAPENPDCFGKAITVAAHTFGGVRAAADFFGVSMQVAHNFVLTTCGRTTGIVPG